MKGYLMFKRLFFLCLPLILFILILRCAHLKEAKQAYEVQDYKKTIFLCKQAVLQDSTDSDAYLLLAKSYHGLGYPDSVYQTLEKNKSAILTKPANRPDVIMLYIETGEKAFKADKKRRAILCFDQAESLNPKSPEALKRIAEFDLNRGKLTEAKEKFSSLMESYPDTVVIRNYINEIDSRSDKAKTIYAKGMKAMKQGSFSKAKKQFDLALQQKPDYTDAQYQNHMAHGRELLRKGSKSILWDAIESFGLAMVLKPELAEPHIRLAQAYEKKSGQEFVNAIDEYKEALKLEPEGKFAGMCRKKIKELAKRKEKLDKFWGR